MALSNAKAYAVLPVDDLQRAIPFYEETLHLARLSEVSGAPLYACGGDTGILLYNSPSGAGPSGATAVTWEVADLAAEMADLRGKGVVFEDYDFDDFQTVNGVYEEPDGSRSSWFKDPAGNVLCLHQQSQ